MTATLFSIKSFAIPVRLQNQHLHSHAHTFKTRLLASNLGMSISISSSCPFHKGNSITLITFSEATHLVNCGLPIPDFFRS
jgi:hypothetical protein